MASEKFLVEAFIGLFLKFSKLRRNFFRLLYWFYKKHPETFISVKEICWQIGFSRRGIKKFLRELRDNKNFQHIESPLQIIPRKNGIGGDSSHEYVLHPAMIKAIQLLEDNNKLDAHRSEALELTMRIMEPKKNAPKGFQKVHPPCIQNKDISIYTRIRKPSPPVCLNPILNSYKFIDPDAKIFASRYASDHEIVEALEACRWQENQKKKIFNPSAYFIGTLKNKMKKRSLQ